MMEVKAVDGGLRLQAGTFEAAFDGAALAGFQFHIGAQSESGRDAEISGCGFSDGGLDLTAHGFERGHRVPFRIRG